MAQADRGLSRLPLSLSRLVGREREIAELTGFLLSDPLVTVTGPGGVGKTRLAVEVAREVADKFPDGVRFVELGGVTDLSRVPAEVAAAMGVPQIPGAAPGEMLAATLAPQRLLLVLDNCEQVAAGVAKLCAELLAAADDVHILATSREQLWVDGEVRYRLSPLALPGSGQLGEIERSAAVALFAERARRAAPQFALTPESAPVAANVVARLDGMPLAIELAAARVEALGLAGLADRIDDALLLESRNLRATPRHRSLAAVADWSYRLLSEAGQRVFRRLAVFPGPFTLEAAEAVAGPGAGATVLLLVDCSLVTPPQPGPDQRMRYALLQTLRAYGQALLAEAGEELRAMAALAAFALPAAQQAAAGLATSDGDRELAALRWMDAEDATLGAALGWALDHAAETALSLAIAMAPWWLARGRMPEGYARLAAAAAHVHSDDPAWADAQQWLGDLATSISNYADSLVHHSAAWETAGDSPSQAALLGLTGRSIAHTNLGHHAEAAADAQLALALARQSGDRVAQVRALTALRANAYNMENYREALAWSRQAVDSVTAEVPGHMVRRCRAQLANVLAALGEYDAARQACTAELAWCRDADDLHGLANLLEMCVIVEDAAGNTGEMAAYLYEAVDVASRTGRRAKLHNYLDEGGNLCAATGRWADAVTLWAAYTVNAERTGFRSTYSSEDSRRRREYMRQIEAVLEPAQLRAAEERGTRMTLAVGAEFIAMLTAPPDSVGPHPVPLDPGPPEDGELTPRERELVTLVAQGSTNTEIAGQLFISVRTVSSHLDRIRAKTGCRRRADLTRLALRAGLV